MKNHQVVDILLRIADILDFKGEMSFKINAYRNAARSISEMTEDIEKVWQEGRLDQIAGVGKALQQKIEEYLTTGHLLYLDEALRDTPKELFKLLQIQNFGPKTAALAYKQLGVETVMDLRRVLENGELSALPGMGEKKAAHILKGLELLETSEGRISIGIALPIALDIISYLDQKFKPAHISPAGSVRRFKETVHDIDILVESEQGTEIIQAFAAMPQVTQVLGAGDTKGSVIINDRFQVDVRVIPPESYGAAQQYFTGSKEHNVRLREIAKKQGLKINEYGIFRDQEKIGGRTEQEIYRHLGMDWIPPELREDRGEIEAASAHRLPGLLDIDDIRADLHIHSNYSDGTLTLAEMADALKVRGYHYMAFCDHSKSARYANGLDENRLLHQIREIRELAQKMKNFTILAGCEVDILNDGSLDFSDEILAQLDFIIASIHSSFTVDPMDRICAAMENPLVDVIGHPTGRLISRREGYKVDIDKLIMMAKKTGTALEVNSYWDRLDLCDLHVKKAVENNVMIAINTDAHYPEHLSMMLLGVGTARRGWAQKSDVINTLSPEELKKWQKRNKK
jgi:DNA polymerase (family X)